MSVTRLHPDVSVVTCVRNQRADYFIECAASIVQQELGNIEWIVVDDCSDPQFKDQSVAVLRTLPPLLRTQFISLPQHSGLAEARNAGISRAVGDWIVVLDSDDRLTAGWATTLSRCPSTTMIVCCASRYFDDQAQEYRSVGLFERLFRQYGGTSLDPFLWYDFYYHGLMARRGLVAAIGMYSSDLTVGEDQDILLRALDAVDLNQVYFASDVGYEYRRNALGVCATQWPDVENNYCRTMLRVACQRAPFVSCRFAGERVMDDVAIDQYQYATSAERWYTWDDWRRHSVLAHQGEQM